MKNYILYFFILSAIILSGCAPGMVRSPGKDVKPGERLEETPTVCRYSEEEKCEESYLQYAPDGNYRLAFLDIDDQGHFGRQRKQLNDVLEFIQEGNKAKRIILFVHGWHHGGIEGDTNLVLFRKLLSTSSRNTEKDVVGIYVSWRGDSITVPLLKELTFWDRKNTSEEVGRGALLEFLVRLEQIWRKDRDVKKINSNLITIGHSFGASVVLSSLKGILIERFATSSPTDEKPPGFGDLVVLVNPAIEAIHYANLREIIEEKENHGQLKFKTNLRPRLIIATSENDFATKYVFQFGRALSTIFESHRDIERVNRNDDVETFSQGEMDRNTVGHYSKFLTHRLSTENELDLDLTTCELKPEPPALYSSRTEKSEVWPIPLEFEGGSKMMLEHLGNSSAYNPYWVVKVNKNIIPNHSKILTGNFVCFIRRFLPEDYIKPRIPKLF
ncbi:MAG: hypothetical protein D3915_08085 [Candidatus Electrothrix sp. AU1_5]|nr:hypothetical protein [Candidatus Electrothrix gigas]